MLQPRNLPVPKGAYTPVSASAGTMYYIAGQVAQDRFGSVVGEGSLSEQIRQVFSNLEKALSAVDLSWDAVVKFNTYIVENQSFAEFDRERSRLFATFYPDGAYPPNTTGFVSGLAKPEFLLEIEAIACGSPPHVQ